MASVMESRIVVWIRLQFWRLHDWRVFHQRTRDWRREQRQQWRKGDAMDYRELLKKYVKLIARSEGIIYLRQMAESGFTAEEIAAINALDDEDLAMDDED